MLIATVGDRKASRRVMPWVMENPRRPAERATPDEVAAAEAELEAGIVFAD